MQLLLNLAKEAGLKEKIDGMMRGDTMNLTESRAVLHAATRARKDQVCTMVLFFRHSQMINAAL